MGKKYKLLVIGILMLFISFIFFLPIGGKEKRLIKAGNELAEKIENYKAAYGKLPNRLEDIGVATQMDGIDTLFYTKQCDFHYTISFGNGLGESIIFFSESKQWKDGPRVINQK